MDRWRVGGRRKIKKEVGGKERMKDERINNLQKYEDRERDKKLGGTDDSEHEKK